MAWLEVIDCKRSVRRAHERSIGLFRGVMSDHLSAPDRRSSGVVNHAVHLAASASSETKDQCDYRARSRANEAERIQYQFSLWGRLVTCRRLAIGANGAGKQPARRIPSCPTHKLTHYVIFPHVDGTTRNLGMLP